MQVRNGRQVEGLCHTYACIRSPATNTPSDLFRMTVRRVFQRRLWSLEFSQINIRCWPDPARQATMVTVKFRDISDAQKPALNAWCGSYRAIRT